MLKLFASKLGLLILALIAIGLFTTCVSAKEGMLVTTGYFVAMEDGTVKVCINIAGEEGRNGKIPLLCRDFKDDTLAVECVGASGGKLVCKDP